MTNQHAGEHAQLTAKFARLAREAVAVGEHVQVWIDGVCAEPATPCSLRIFDRDGIPYVACRDTHPITAGVGRQVRIIIRHYPRQEDMGMEATIIVTGRLQQGVTSITPMAPGMVAMAVDISAVFVEQQPVAGPLCTIHVPVSQYLAVDIDPLASHQTVVAAHFNTVHGSELRDCVARCTSQTASAIAAATIAELTAEFVTLGWIDYDGTHTTTLTFARRATEPDEMDALLHDCLSNAG